MVRRVKYDWIILTEDPLIELVKREIKEEDLLEQLLPVKNKLARDILSSKIGFSSYFQSIGIDTPAYVGFQPGVNDFNELVDIDLVLIYTLINICKFLLNTTSTN